MSTNIVFVICFLAIYAQVTIADPQLGGYASIPSPVGQHSLNINSQQVYQDLKPPAQDQTNTGSGSFFGKTPLTLPAVERPSSLPLPLPKAPNPPSLDFELPLAPQVHDFNYSPGQQFNPNNENVMRFAFRPLDENKGNSIEQGCGPETIVGQFKPELVDLANGGPLKRVITTCGPNGDCKSLELQSDLNRVLAVLPNQLNQNQNAPQAGRPEFFAQIDNQNNGGGGFVGGPPYVPPLQLIRPLGRRLIEYTEILQDDLYN